MKKIKNIVVATDFSVTARNAYRYANELANALNATLTIVHVKESIVMHSDVVIAPSSSEDNMELIKDLKELIAEEDFVIGKSATKQEVKIKVLNGHPVDVLIEMSKTSNTDLIVIGATGLADVLTKIFGSISIKISNQAYCPVILVPREAKWQGIRQILFASDYDSMTTELSHNIIDFAVNMHAAIHFVNVRNYDPPFEAKQKDIDWDKLFVVSDSDLSVEKHTIYGNNAVEELKKYSEEKHIDMIAFASKHRSFWENLMHKSITENMALSAIVPIMVMHLDDK